MTEHVHEWNITGTPAMFEIVCSSPNCAKEMSFDEAEARLNATERFVTFMEEYYSIRGVIEPVKSDSEEDRLLKETYAEMKQWMEDE